MKKLQIVRLVRRVALTLDRELDCGECADLVPQYVDALLAGQDRLERWALVQQHFEQCIGCSEEFALLHECAKLELNGCWPNAAQLLDGVMGQQLNA